MCSSDLVGNNDGGVAQGLAGGVHDVPLADDIALICHKSGHWLASPLDILPSITKEQEDQSCFLVIEGSLVFLLEIRYNDLSEQIYL